MKQAEELESGFSIIELMIVLAITGILTAVAIPAYMNYVSKTRVVSNVYPGLHSIQNKIALNYVTNRQLPDNSQLSSMMVDADTHYFNVDLSGGSLNLTIVNDPSDNIFQTLNGNTLTTTPVTVDGKIINWNISGSLASKLNLN